MAKKKLITYEFNKDYPLAGKKQGDRIAMPSLPLHLKSYLDEVESEEEEEEIEDTGDTPTKEWSKDDITAWLHANGHEAKGTKEELLKEVKKVLKG